MRVNRGDIVLVDYPFTAWWIAQVTRWTDPARHELARRMLESRTKIGSASGSSARGLAVDDGVCLDFHQGLVVNQLGDLNHRRRGAD